MNKRILLWLTVSLSAPLTLPIHQARAADPESAAALIGRYLELLVIGDTPSIEQMLGGPFLARQSALLQNPEYRDVLTTVYAGSTHEIVSVTPLEDGSMGVQIRIVLADGEEREHMMIVGDDVQTGEPKLMEEAELQPPQEMPPPTM